MSINLYQNGLHKLDDLIFKINKPLIGKKGVHYQKLLKDWPQIVGEYIGNFTIPMKISSIKHKNILANVLHVAANNAAAAIEMSYHIGVIKEQVNVYFGYEYIQQVKLSQAVFSTANPVGLKQRDFSEEEVLKADKLTQYYDQEDDIKNILIELAKNIAQRR